MCLICDRIDNDKNRNQSVFCQRIKSETGYVVIGDNQHFYGYTLFLYKNHSKTELFWLDMPERKKFLGNL